MGADPLTERTVNDLFNDLDGWDSEDDVFADKNLSAERDDKATLSPRKRKVDDDKENLAVDEEVKITKKRKPIAKLDVERLLSQPGIPKLREVTRSNRLSKKLRFKGKGHEFSDIGKLLNHYQLWLDNLYPRAKFADALQLVEKAGHQKRMQVMRKAWIDEGKPGYAREKALMEEGAEQEKQNQSHTNIEDGHNADADTVTREAEDEDAMFFNEGNVTNDPREDGPDEDELDALLAQQDHIETANTAQKNLQDSDSEGEDDLDALLAEHETQKKSEQQGVAEDEEDELDALLNQQQALQPSITAKPAAQIIFSAPDTKDSEVQDGDALDELLAEQSDIPEPQLPSRESIQSQEVNLPQASEEDVPELINTISSSPIPNVQTDDLDQLMDEHEAANRKELNVSMEEHFLSSSPVPNTESQ